MINAKDLKEIGRRYKAEHNNIRHIYGYFINDEGNIVAEFEESLTNMPLDCQDKYLTLLKKACTGKIGQTILPIHLDSSYMQESAHYKLLSELRDCAMETSELRSMLCEKIRRSGCMEGNYLILMCAENYDIPSKSDDGDGDSGEVHRYIVVSVCPVPNDKAKLVYDPRGKRFEDSGIRQLASNPVLGFTFPAFDNRQTDIGEIVTMTSGKADYEGFIRELLDYERPKNAAEQKEVFVEALRSTLKDDLDYESLSTATAAIVAYSEEAKENGENADSMDLDTISAVMERNLNVSADEFKEVLESGLDDTKEIPVANICDPKAIQISAPGMKIKISRELEKLVSVSEENGVKRLVIQIPEGIEVDGVSVEG